MTAFAVFDASSLLPDGWASEVIQTVGALGARVVKKGRGPGSLEPEDTAGLDYHVLTGDRIIAAMPWLWAVYRSPALLEMVQRGIPEQVRPVTEADAKWGLNINKLAGRGGRYELHVDQQPYTAILYATAHAPGDGGELEVRLPASVAFLMPWAGQLVVFDGSRLPHGVRPLAVDAVRVSIPMHFIPLDQSGRSARADDYLYSAAKP